MDTNSTITGRTTTNSISSVRYMSVTAMLSAVAFILMFLDFSVPFMPAFIKMDLSELPALIGAFSMGPVCGILICLIKNVLHLFITTTGGVGELSNFLLGVAFVLPAGLIYRLDPRWYALHASRSQIDWQSRFDPDSPLPLPCTRRPNRYRSGGSGQPPFAGSYVR